MHPRLAKQLNDVLDIIGYTADRDQYAKHYFNVCVQQAVTLLVDSLPEHDKLEFEPQFVAALENGDHSRATALLKHTFSRIEFDRAMEEVMFDDMVALGDEVLPTLPEERQGQLEQYLSRLSASRAHLAAL